MNPNLKPDQAAIEKICCGLAAGESLYRICEQEGLPSRQTVYNWVAKDEKVFTAIARAREAGQDALIDECRKIADEATPEDVNVAKLRIWHRQWEAAKRAPRQFGDKLQQQITGSDGGPVVFTLKRLGEPSLALPAPIDEDEDDASL